MEYKLEWMTWVANILNFLIVIFLALKSFGSPCFSFSDTFIAIWGLGVAIMVQVVGLIVKLSRET